MVGVDMNELEWCLLPDLIHPSFNLQWPVTAYRDQTTNVALPPAGCRRPSLNNIWRPDIVSHDIIVGNDLLELA